MSNAIVSKGIFNEKPKNNQEAFARVWQRFIIEKAPIAVEQGTWTCRYRVSPNHGCAIGVQMPDTIYTPELEKSDGYTLLVTVNPTSVTTGQPLDKAKITELRRHFVRVAPALLMALQQAHDTSSDIYGFASKLIGIADDFQLDIPGGAA